MALWAVFLGFGSAFKSLVQKDRKTALIGSCV